MHPRILHKNTIIFAIFFVILIPVVEASYAGKISISDNKPYEFEYRNLVKGDKIHVDMKYKQYNTVFLFIGLLDEYRILENDVSFESLTDWANFSELSWKSNDKYEYEILKPGDYIVVIQNGQFGSISVNVRIYLNDENPISLLEIVIGMGIGIFLFGFLMRIGKSRKKTNLSDSDLPKDIPFLWGLLWLLLALTTGYLTLFATDNEGWEPYVFGITLVLTIASFIYGYLKKKKELRIF